jgi:uncharacterized protein YfkK (UPF0435 family)
VTDGIITIQRETERKSIRNYTNLMTAVNEITRKLQKLWMMLFKQYIIMDEHIAKLEYLWYMFIYKKNRCSLKNYNPSQKLSKLSYITFDGSAGKIITV